MFCSECGFKNRNDRKFCQNCGTALHDYTKPKQNLIQPKELERAQAEVVEARQIKRAFNIGNLCVVLALIVCVALSFVFGGTAKLVILIVSICLLVLYIILGIVQFVLLKAKQKFKQNNSNENDS